MVNVLYADGNGRGSIRLEELFDEVAHEETIAIFCSFLMDKYDPKIYDGAFGDVCRTHAHVIPAEDYDRHRDAVNLAVALIVGRIEGRLLRSLVGWKHDMASRMPASQAVLLWIKAAVPGKFDDVLACARECEAQAIAARS
jgi:hypothetical protein